MYRYCVVVVGLLLLFRNIKELCFKLTNYLRLFLLLNSLTKKSSLEERVCSNCYSLS